MGFSACSNWSRLAAVTLLLIACATPAAAANRRVIELQVRVRTMSDQAMIMQQSMDQDFGAITQSLQQSATELAMSQKKLARLQEATATSEAARAGSPHHIAEVADIHGNEIQCGARAAGDLLQTGDAFCVRRLSGDDAWNAALQKILHDRLADEAHCNELVACTERAGRVSQRTRGQHEGCRR